MKTTKEQAAAKPRARATIPEIKRVLVTTDFSPLGDAAIPFAYAMLPRGAAVLLLHVVEPYDLPGPLVPHYEKGRLTKKEHLKHTQSCAERLTRLIPSVAAGRGIESRVEVVESRRAGRAICEEAKRFGADMICIGSHGRSALLRMALGSVAADVVARSKRPVLVVRPKT